MKLLDGAFPLDNTIASFFVIKKKIINVKFIMDYFIQVLFLLFNTYFLIINKNNIEYIIIYSVLLMIGIVNLISTVVSNIKKQRKNKILYYFLNIFKLCVKLASIIITIYYVLTLNKSTLNILITALTILMFILQVSITIIIVLIEKISFRFEVSFRMDKEESGLLRHVLKESGAKQDGYEIESDEHKMREKILNDTDEFFSNNSKKAKIRSKRRKIAEERLNDKCIEKIIKNNSKEAEQYITEYDKMDLFLFNVEGKLSKLPHIKELSYLPVGISMIKNYMQGRYTEVPKKTIVSLVGALIYLVTPIDIIPDTIPIIGYIDDAKVLNFCVKNIKSDLDNYIKWREERVYVPSLKVEVVGFYQENDPYWCFSNWYPCEFKVNGITFISAEQYIMYKKAHIMGDDEAANAVLKTKTPGDAKNIARDVKGNIELWDEMKYEVAKDGIRAKLKQNKDILKKLLDTKDMLIAECSSKDTTWGIGLSLEDKKFENPNNWRGKNYLGKILMDLRKELK